MHMLNEHDSCCFYTTQYTNFESDVSGTVEAMGCGIYKVHGYDWPGRHGVRESEVDVVMAALKAGTYPRVQAWAIVSSDAELRWSSLATQAYSVWTCSDLGTGAWSLVEGGITATPPENVYGIPIPGEEVRYYRLGAEDGW
jgi:hypothetical protein